MSVASIIKDLDRRDMLERARRVAYENRVSVEDMLGRGRKFPEARARRQLWGELYDLGCYSLPVLGRIFERDHTTILFAVSHKRRAKCGARWTYDRELCRARRLRLDGPLKIRVG